MLRAVTVSTPKIEQGEVTDKEGRSFEGVLVASVSKEGETAPLYAAFVVTEGQFKPFWANLRTGADVALFSMTEDLPQNYGRRGNSAPTIAFPTKAPLIWVPTQRTTKGHLMQIYNARYFHFATGRVEGALEFVLMPPRDRLATEQERAGKQHVAVIQHFKKLAALYEDSQEESKPEYGYYSRTYKHTKKGYDEQAAYCKPYADVIGRGEDLDAWDCLEARAELLCAFLLQRSGLPMPEDVRFFAQVWFGLRASRHLLTADEDRSITVRGLDNPDLGLSQPWFVCVRTDTLREFLAMQVRFFEKANAMAEVADLPKEPPNLSDSAYDIDGESEEEDE